MDPNRRPLTSRDYRWVQALARFLAHAGVTPNSISVAGAVFATMGALCFLQVDRSFRGSLRRAEASTFHRLPDPTFAAFGFHELVGDEINKYGLQVDASEHRAQIGWSCLVVAVVCIQLRLLCNLLDGLVAVEGGRKGKAGQLFNEAPDRYADVVLLAAAGCAIGKPWLGWMTATFSVATAYARAFGASLGLGQDFCGPFAKQQRLFFLTAGTLAGLVRVDFLCWTLWLIAAGALITFLRRIVRIYRRLP